MRSNYSLFAKESLDPAKKETKDFALQIARAIWAHDQTKDNASGNINRDIYNDISRWYFNEVNIDDFKPFLGVNPNDAQNTFLPAIDWSITNYLNKRVNIAQSKLASIKYDPIVDTVDPFSAAEKQSQLAKIQYISSYYKDLQEAGMSARQLSDMIGSNIEYLPKSKDEIELFTSLNGKHWASIKLEKAIKGISDANNWEEIRRKYIFDLIMYGFAHVRSYMGDDFNPVVKWCHPAKSIIPYSDSSDYHDINWVGYEDEYSIQDVAKMFPHLDESDLDEIYKFSGVGVLSHRDTLFNRDNLARSNYRDVPKVRILNFEYYSVNESVFVKTYNKIGNIRIDKKPFDYYSGKEDVFRDKYRTEREILRPRYGVWYEGWWVIGSDIILSWRRRTNVPFSKAGHPLSGHTMYSPNMRDGRSVSLGEMSVPVLRKIHQRQLKIQHLFAAEIPSGIQINLADLRMVDIKGLTGANMSEMELLNLFLQKGILVTNNNDRRAGINNKPFERIQGGVADSIVHHFNDLQNQLITLDEILGYNQISLGSPLATEQTKGVAQMQVQQTEAAFEFIAYADTQIHKGAYSNMAKLHCIAEKYSPYKYESQNIFGTVPLINKSSDITRYDFGINIEARPTDQQWAEFYQRIEGAYTSGKITASDLAMLYLCKSIKEAYVYLSIYEKRRESDMQASKMNEIQAQSQAQMQSQQMAAQIAIQMEEMKTNRELMLADKRMAEIQLEYDLRYREFGFKTTANHLNRQSVQEKKTSDNIRQAYADAMIQQELEKNQPKEENE